MAGQLFFLLCCRSALDHIQRGASSHGDALRVVRLRERSTKTGHLQISVGKHHGETHIIWGAFDPVGRCKVRGCAFTSWYPFLLIGPWVTTNMAEIGAYNLASLQFRPAKPNADRSSETMMVGRG